MSACGQGMHTVDMGYMAVGQHIQWHTLNRYCDYLKISVFYANIV